MSEKRLSDAEILDAIESLFEQFSKAMMERAFNHFTWEEAEI